MQALTAIYTQLQFVEFRLTYKSREVCKVTGRLVSHNTRMTLQQREPDERHCATTAILLESIAISTCT